MKRCALYCCAPVYVKEFRAMQGCEDRTMFEIGQNHPA